MIATAVLILCEHYASMLSFLELGHKALGVAESTLYIRYYYHHHCQLLVSLSYLMAYRLRLIKNIWGNSSEHSREYLHSESTRSEQSVKSQLQSLTSSLIIHKKRMCFLLRQTPWLSRPTNTSSSTATTQIMIKGGTSVKKVLTILVFAAILPKPFSLLFLSSCTLNVLRALVYFMFVYKKKDVWAIVLYAHTRV